MSRECTGTQAHRIIVFSHIFRFTIAVTNTSRRFADSFNEAGGVGNTPSENKPRRRVLRLRDKTMPSGAMRSVEDNTNGDGRSADVQAAERETPGGMMEERRKHPRHRYIERLYVGKKDGMWFTAMTYEISVAGLSAATTTELKIGEKVRLSPVADKRVEAIVRRKQGAMYGFEFIGITPQIEAHLVKLCEGLPLFQSLIDV